MAMTKENVFLIYFKILINVFIKNYLIFLFINEIILFFFMGNYCPLGTLSKIPIVEGS